MSVESRCGRFNPCLARSYHRHPDATQLRLRRRRQLAEIPFDCHASHMAKQPESTTFLTLGLVIYLRARKRIVTLLHYRAVVHIISSFSRPAHGVTSVKSASPAATPAARAVFHHALGIVARGYNAQV